MPRTMAPLCAPMQVVRMEGQTVTTLFWRVVHASWDFGDVSFDIGLAQMEIVQGTTDE